MRSSSYQLFSIIGLGALIVFFSSNKLSLSEHPVVLMSTLKTASQLPEGFVYLNDVDPTIRQEVRYAGNNNFVGRPIKGYERSTIILSKQAAQALARVQTALKKSSKGKWTLLVYDGYRPQRAVNDFWQWSQDLEELTMKATFYPSIADKSELFKQGYIAHKSGHSRGSTVDLTIAFASKQGTIPIDMGAPFDLFDPQSHYISDKISPEAQRNRKYLRDLMAAHGFAPYEKEWWHFTLQEEPFPDTYFDFPVQ